MLTPVPVPVLAVFTLQVVKLFRLGGLLSTTATA